MPGIDPETGMFALPLWAVAAGAALFVVVCVKAFTRPSAGTLGPVVRASIIVASAIVVAWMIVDRASVYDRDAERRALEGRATDLTVRAIEQGSPLACLDGLAGDTVETACEKAIFADPETVAAAISYLSARLTLLGDMVDFSKVRGSDLETSLVVLRRSIEADRFGIVAHVLSVRDGCTAQRCDALTLLRDASRVRINLNAHLLDRYLNHYAIEWAKAPATSAPVADATSPAKPKVSVNVDFPSAASIPPVSIMNPEPTGPVLPGVAAAAAANPNPPAAVSATPARRSRKQTASPAPPSSAPPPHAAAVQPAPAQPAAAQLAPSSATATTGAAVVPPVQLVPFPPPEANAGMTTRAQ